MFVGVCLILVGSFMRDYLMIDLSSIVLHFLVFVLIYSYICEHGRQRASSWVRCHLLDWLLLRLLVLVESPKYLDLLSLLSTLVTLRTLL